MAETQPGSPYTPYFLVLDATGAPYTSGVSGTMVLDSPTAAAVGAGALTYLGDGRWGTSFAGSLLTTPGTYRFSVAALVTPGGTLTDQAGVFAVGTPAPGQLTVRDLLCALCLPLDDGWAGTTTSAGALNGSVDGTLIDAQLVNADGVTDDWRGTEVLPFQAGHPTSVASLGYRVTGYAPSTGTLTLRPVQPALIAAGTDYLACNVNGRGFGVQRRLWALRGALRKGGATRRVSEQIGTVIATRTDEYAIPPHFASLTGVALRGPTDQADRWTPLGPHLLRDAVRADRRLVTLRGWPAGTLVQLTGWSWASLPYLLDEYVDGPADWYLAQAAADLLKASRLAEHQRMAGPLYQEAAATRPRRSPDANEVTLA